MLARRDAALIVWNFFKMYLEAGKWLEVQSLKQIGLLQERSAWSMP